MIVKYPLAPTLVVLACAMVGCAPKSQVAVHSSPPAVSTTLNASSPENPSNAATSAKVDPSAPVNAQKAPDDQKKGEALMDEIKRQAEERKVVISIPQAKTSGWGKTSMSMTGLAKRVADATTHLEGTYGQLTTHVQTPEGTGYFEGDLKVRDSKTYYIDFVVVAERPFSGTLAADGTHRIVRVGDDLSALKPVSEQIPVAKAHPETLVQAWPEDFSRLAFQGLTEGEDAWAQVLKGFESGAAGYKATLEERRIVSKGREFLAYRILARRPADPKRKIGSSEVEIVVDGKWFLPVTIRTVSKDAEGGNWKVQWNAQYRFKQTFVPENFQLGPLKKPAS